MVVFASHVALVEGKEYDGIGNTLKATLGSTVDEYIFVRNSIDGRLPSEVQIYTGGSLRASEDLGVISKFGPIRYVSEYIKTVRYFKTRRKVVDVYIGVDPLNALSAIRLRNKGVVSKAVFYTADYSPKRFANPILNFMYHAIDLYCVRHADEVWSVSTRICEVRRKIGLAEEKNVFIPNVPPVEYDSYKHNARDKFKLITTGILDKQLDFDGAIKAISILRDEFPNLTMTIIGNGPEETRLRELASHEGVAGRIEFTGRLPLEQALELQSKAGIGLALYTGVWGFNYYGDSTKCREYFNFSLPVISTDTHSTVEDIRESGAGEIVDLDYEQYVAAIRKIIGSYDSYSLASGRVGEMYSGVHRREVERLLGASRGDD